MLSIRGLPSPVPSLVTRIVVRCLSSRPTLNLSKDATKNNNVLDEETIKKHYNAWMSTPAKEASPGQAARLAASDKQSVVVGQDESPPASGATTRLDKRGRVVVVTSGKGGVGKTTSSASFAMGLALRGKRTVAIDFDIGLRNLDLHLGCERRVIFDFVNVLLKECTLRQALIRDKHCEQLYMLAASQTRDKTVLTTDGVQTILDELCRDFDYVVCDSPAGIESGALHAMYFADDAIITTNPEMSSVRDSDKMIGIIESKSRRALSGQIPVKQQLLITRYDAEKVRGKNMLSVEDINEILALPVVGVVPESDDVLKSSNVGSPVILSDSNAGIAYTDMVGRFLGESIPMKYLTPQKKGFLRRVFGS